MATVVAALGLALPAGAAAAGPPVKEFTLPTLWVGSLAKASGGTVAYGGTVVGPGPGNGAGVTGRTEGRIGRVGPKGPIGELVPVPTSFPGPVAVGEEGDTWFQTFEGTVGRVLTNGAFTSAALAPGNDFVGYTAAAKGGGVWFTKGRGSAGPDTVGRISTAGVVSEFSLPNPESQPMAIAEGPEGNAWFTEHFGNQIGEVTPAGQVTEFPLPVGTFPHGIAVDSHGSVWFTETGGTGGVGRLDSAGKLEEFRLPGGIDPIEIAAAADGRVWFTERESSRLGRLTPEGRFSEVALPNSFSRPDAVIAGSEGNVWYAAMGEGPCLGGSSCLGWAPTRPAIVGRIGRAPLRTAVTAAVASVARRRAQVPVLCEGGDASDRCHGRIVIQRGGRTVGSGGYSLAADQRSKVAVPLSRSFAGSLATSRRMKVVAVARASSGKSSRRGLTLRRG